MVLFIESFITTEISCVDDDGNDKVDGRDAGRQAEDNSQVVRSTNRRQGFENTLGQSRGDLKIVRNTTETARNWGNSQLNMHYDDQAGFGVNRHRLLHAPTSNSWTDKTDKDNQKQLEQNMAVTIW